MRRIYQLCTLGVAAGVMGACAPDQVVTTPVVPTAGVRFINAVPDTGAMDFRFVDMTTPTWNQPRQGEANFGRVKRPSCRPEAVARADTRPAAEAGRADAAVVGVIRPGDRRA